ncbi:DUF624 domain-containing protein [Wukongibacter baidiensis]|uniref:DUF624 domain-containing protein n=1 Tax=Wukongibacter baidiensis TaxID=1723361 RepID=UPI003D7F4F13
MKGMLSLQRFERIGNIIFNMMYLNILWIIFSLPIITMGAATASMLDTIGQVEKDKNSVTFKAYYKAFSYHFLLATPLFLIITSIIAIAIRNIQHISEMGNLSGYFYGMQLIAICFALILFIYGYPLMILKRFKLTEIIKISLRVGFGHIIRTLGFITMLYLLITKFHSLLIIKIGLWGYIQYYFVNKIIEKYNLRRDNI